jgi:gliding motility-associated-like protein
VLKLYFAHDFKVRVTDALGCIAEDMVRVDVKKVRNIYVPEGFTPNSDGSNDVLMVHGQRDAKILQFRVYDRWGELLYVAENFDPNDPSIGWDGTFRGNPNDPGVYIWVLEVEYLDGIQDKMKGHSMLIR